MVIKTPFDNPLEEDIALEEVESQMTYADVLKNSENIVKSFLYLQKLIDQTSPFVNKVIKVDTIDATIETVPYVVGDNTGKILLKNISSTDNAFFLYNGGKFILFPFESIEMPITKEDTLALSGMFSIMETEYTIGKE